MACLNDRRSPCRCRNVAQHASSRIVNFFKSYLHPSHSTCRHSRAASPSHSYFTNNPPNIFERPGLQQLRTPSAKIGHTQASSPNGQNRSVTKGDALVADRYKDNTCVTDRYALNARRPFSRLRYFSTVAMYWTCRTCGAQFRYNARGLLVAGGFLAILAALWYLRVTRVVPPLIVSGLFLVLLGLVVWLMPILTPIKAKVKTWNER